MKASTAAPALTSSMTRRGFFNFCTISSSECAPITFVPFASFSRNWSTLDTVLLNAQTYNTTKHRFILLFHKNRSMFLISGKSSEQPPVSTATAKVHLSWPQKPHHSLPAVLAPMGMGTTKVLCESQMQCASNTFFAFLRPANELLYIRGMWFHHYPGWSCAPPHHSQECSLCVRL